MAELALGDDQPDAFVGHLDSVGVTELMRRKPWRHAGGGGGGSPPVGSDGGR